MSAPVRFSDVDWTAVPDSAGAYVIYDDDEVLYVGMAGRDQKGSLRRREFYCFEEWRHNWHTRKAFMSARWCVVKDSTAEGG